MSVPRASRASASAERDERATASSACVLPTLSQRREKGVGPSELPSDGRCIPRRNELIDAFRFVPGTLQGLPRRGVPGSRATLTCFNLEPYARPEELRNLGRKRVLQREHLAARAVDRLARSPDLLPLLIEHGDGEAKHVAGLLDLPLDERPYVEGARDAVRLRPAELRHAVAGDHGKRLDLAQLADQRLGQAIGEELE